MTGSQSPVHDRTATGAHLSQVSQAACSSAIAFAGTDITERLC